MMANLQSLRKPANALMPLLAPMGGTLLQRKSTSFSSPSPRVPPIVNDVLRSSGQPLDRSTREAMETQFQHDFSKVRIHTDQRAAESAQQINASAYTVGPHIAFGHGKFLPDSADGRQLLAHELTHVVQQGTDCQSNLYNLKIADNSVQSEHEAESIAKAVAGAGPNEHRISRSWSRIVSRSPDDKTDKAPSTKPPPIGDPKRVWSGAQDFVLTINTKDGSCFTEVDAFLPKWTECPKPLVAYPDEPIGFQLRYRIDWAGGPQYPGPKGPLQGFSASVLFEFTNGQGRKKELIRATDSAPRYEPGPNSDTIVPNLGPIRKEGPFLVVRIPFTESGQLRTRLQLHYDGPPAGDLILDEVMDVDFVPSSPGTETGIYLIVPDPTNAPLVYKRLTGKEGWQKPPAVVVTVWSDDRGYYYNSKRGKVRLPERP